MRSIAIWWLCLCGVGCAVTETGTPGADPSVDVPLSTLEAMQLQDDPGSPYVAVDVRVPVVGELSRSNAVAWTHVATGEVTAAELSAAQFEATLSFLPEQPVFRLSVWDDALEVIAIADLRFDFASQRWLPQEDPCLHWSNRAALSSPGEPLLVAIENECGERREALFQPIHPTRGEPLSRELEAGSRALVELVAEPESGRSVWQLQPGGALLDVFGER